MDVRALQAGLGFVRPDKQQPKPSQTQAEPAAARAASGPGNDGDVAPAQRVQPADEGKGDNASRDASDDRNPFARVNILV
jgi:hypothetical protein